jgi:hypothetical protein
MDETHPGPSWSSTTEEHHTVEREADVGEGSSALATSRTERFRRVLLFVMLAALLIAWVVLLRVVH